MFCLNDTMRYYLCPGRTDTHLRNPSMPKSRLAEHSSEVSETSSSLCTGWLHCILD